MKKKYLLLLIAIVPIQLFSQGWSVLPNIDDVLLGISYSMNTNSIPDKINNVRPGAIKKNLFIISAALQEDYNDGYSRYQPSAAFMGDLLWANGNTETDMSLLTGGFFGNFDRGINFIKDGKMRIGAGGTVEDFVMATDTYDYGYHMAIGPNAKCDYLLNDSWFARIMVKYTFSFWHYVNADDPDKTFQEKAKHPSFLTFDLQAISIGGLNVRIEYWSALSSEDAGLSLNRFWIHAAIPFSRVTQ